MKLLLSAHLVDWRVCAYPRVIFIVVITEIGQILQLLRKTQFVKNKKMPFVKYNNTYPIL